MARVTTDPSGCFRKIAGRFSDSECVVLASIESRVDPQADAATRLIAWASFGQVRLTEDDFSVLRRLLLAMLPQIGGVLLMVGRTDT